MRSRLEVLTIVLVALVVPGLVGCGEEGGQTGPARYKVTGTVKLDGKTIEGAEVIFEGDVSKGEANDVGTTDASGNYSVEVTDGKKKVKISKKEGIGEKDATGVYPNTKELFPAKFNESTTLEKTIEKKDQTINFDLQTAG